MTLEYTMKHLSPDKVSELSKGMQINYNLTSLERAYQSNNGFILDSNTPNIEDGYLKWTGNNEYIKSELPIIGDELTFNLWYKGNPDISNRYPILVLNQDNDYYQSPTNQFWIGTQGNYVGVHFWGGTDLWGGNITDNNWHMITVYVKTHKTDTTQRIVKLYLDSVKLGEKNYNEGNYSFNFKREDFRMWLGYNHNPYSIWAKSLKDSYIGNVSISTKELTQNDINKLYEGGI